MKKFNITLIIKDIIDISIMYKIDNLTNITIFNLTNQ